MKTKETRLLEKALWQYTTNASRYVYGAFEVTIGYASSNGRGYERADYMTIDNAGTIRSYEIKTSVSDFHSKALLSWIGHYNYLVLTKDLYEKIKNTDSFQHVTWSAGVLVADSSSWSMSTIVKPRRKQLTIGQSVEIVESIMKASTRDSYKLYAREDYWQ